MKTIVNIHLKKKIPKKEKKDKLHTTVKAFKNKLGLPSKFPFHHSKDKRYIFSFANS